MFIKSRIFQSIVFSLIALGGISSSLAHLACEDILASAPSPEFVQFRDDLFSSDPQARTRALLFMQSNSSPELNSTLVDLALNADSFWSNIALEILKSGRTLNSSDLQRLSSAVISYSTQRTYVSARIESGLRFRFLWWSSPPISESSPTRVDMPSIEARRASQNAIEVLGTTSQTEATQVLIRLFRSTLVTAESAASVARLTTYGDSIDRARASGNYADAARNDEIARSILKALDKREKTEEENQAIQSILTSLLNNEFTAEFGVTLLARNGSIEGLRTLVTRLTQMKHEVERAQERRRETQSLSRWSYSWDYVTEERNRAENDHRVASRKYERILNALRSRTYTNQEIDLLRSVGSYSSVASDLQQIISRARRTGN